MSIKILFVCMGNICRSPTAEVIFNAILIKKGFSNQISTDSAGTHAFNIGRNPDIRAIEEAKNRGYDMSSHKSRQINHDDFINFDLIIGMDFENMSFLRKKCPFKELYKLSLLMRYSSQYNLDVVPDPYYDELDGFSKVFDYIEDACQGLFEFVYKNYSSKLVT
ncbi:protein-tyrosine phosphatase [Candidatus Kinetoplastibacterium desouzaii TCC079E]|uniref:protein-tyrosine-phosphatase n=1 Tax=Candidatus Kinetoplastidibacterium desouzai TCC079E TaxID=1208919 RepID=M1L226_9PROT|nr:low molecular weight protein-tyrosine-phosphatase [Candidatus Kinetoplastibacterium desouzaii]AGF46803.1 protein-tyrosine phosphatase [Candidatus Kinetoplastibacterium desouzaii TCC079E]